MDLPSHAYILVDNFTICRLYLQKLNRTQSPLAEWARETHPILWSLTLTLEWPWPLRPLRPFLSNLRPNRRCWGRHCCSHHCAWAAPAHTGSLCCAANSLWLPVRGRTAGDVQCSPATTTDGDTQSLTPQFFSHSFPSRDFSFLPTFLPKNKWHRKRKQSSS